MLEPTHTLLGYEKVPMRYPADSMTNSPDDRILEFLYDRREDRPVGYGPSDMVEEIDYKRQHLNRRLIALEDLDLVLNLGRGSYIITDLGEQYLAGELDARTLEADEKEGEQSEE